MEHIRTWTEDGFKLDLFDTYKMRDGKTQLAYRFEDRGQLIFKGDDFYCSPLHAIDSDQTVSCLLGFLSLQSGDTDSDYFTNYSPAQIEWRDSGRAETLSMLVYDMENPED